MLFQKQLFFDYAKFSFHIDRTHIIVSDPFVGVICQGYAAEIIDTLDALCIMAAPFVQPPFASKRDRSSSKVDFF